MMQKLEPRTVGLGLKPAEIGRVHACKSRGDVSSSVIRQHPPPNIFHGSEKVPIQCIVNLPANQDAQMLIVQRKSVLSAAFFVNTAVITNLHHKYRNCGGAWGP